METNMKHAIKIIAAYACVFFAMMVLFIAALYEFRNEPKTEYYLCVCFNHIERCLSSSHSHFIVVHETSLTMQLLLIVGLSAFSS